MNKRTGRTLLATLLALSSLTLQAQSTNLLEGFEQGFTTNSAGATNLAVFTLLGGRAADGQVSVSVFHRTGPTDARVTEGTNSIAVTLGESGFGNDVLVTLSDEASAAIQDAVATNQLARYVLRYDLIFPGASRYGYWNSIGFVGASWDYTTLGAVNSKGVVSLSVALDINNLGLPTSGPISWIIGNSFNTVQPFTNFVSKATFYIDNIRLVDTYGAGATPVTYLLQSFEDAANPLGGATNHPGFSGSPKLRTTYSRHLVNGDPADLSVTDGQYSLQVSNRAPDGFQSDFTLPFAGTRLAEVLGWNLPVSQRPKPAQLAHYTLRWDVLFPDVGASVYVNQPYHSGSAYFPVVQSRQEIPGGPDQLLTYSTTLDQIAAWGGLTGDPALLFLNDGPPVASGFNNSTYYYDNFRLIDTAPPPPLINVSHYNPATGQFALTWSSMPGATYSVEVSATLTPVNFTALATGIPSGGSQTTTTVAMPNGNAGFLRVLKE